MILIPNQMRNGEDLVFDIPREDKPLPYEKTDRSSSFLETTDRRRILREGWAAGCRELQNFVEAGGLLVTLGTSSAFPPDFGLTPTIETSNSGRAILCAGTDCGGGHFAAGESDLLWVSAKTVPVRYATDRCCG